MDRLIERIRRVDGDLARLEGEIQSMGALAVANRALERNEDLTAAWKAMAIRAADIALLADEFINPTSNSDRLTHEPD